MATFPITEYKQRIANVKKAMQEQGVDILIAGNPANMYYLTGYDGKSYYVPQMVIIALAEELPFWIGRSMDLNGARITTWLPEENLMAYQDDYVQSLVKHPMNFVADFFKKKGWASKNIGMDLDLAFTSPRCYLELVKDLPNAIIKDSSLLVNWVRIVKSDSEIVYIRNAAKIVDNAFGKAFEVMAPGVRESQAAAVLHHALIGGVGDIGGDYPSGPPTFLTGERASTAHYTWTDLPYERDQVSLLETAGCYRRYHCPMSRTIYFGKPPKKLVDIAQRTIAAIEVALDTIKSGMTCEEVEQAWWKALGGESVMKEVHRLGYSTGIGYPPDWGEHTASMRAHDKTVLQPNMVFHLIPSVWGKDFAFSVSETIRVTETGCETFATFPRKLHVK